jgi:hypothetical protein
MSGKLSEYVKKNYPDSKSDLFAVFIERCTQMTKNFKFQAMITQHAFMFLSSFEKLRSKISHNDFINMVHLGARAFEEIAGEVVQTTSFIIRKSNITNYKVTYSRVVEQSSQKAKENAYLSKSEMYVVQKKAFTKIPGMPLAYWVNNNVFDCFNKGVPFQKIGNPKVGMQTSNNDKYLRIWTEIRFDEFISSKKKWIKYIKGGTFRRWYGNLDWLVWYNGSPQHILKQKNARVLPESDLELIKCTWTDLATTRFSCRLAPNDSFHDISGHCFYPSAENQLYLLAFSNTRVFQLLIDLLNSSLHYQVGDVARVPVIVESDYVSRVNGLAHECIEISRSDWNSFETSWDFYRNQLACSSSNIIKAFSSWEAECNKRITQLKANEEELNRIFIDIYGLKDEINPEVEDKDITIRKANLDRDIRSFISYAVGCIFGRYSLDENGLVYAGGHWDKSKYKTLIPDKDNILPITDEEYFKDDLTGLFIGFVAKIYGKETLEENLDYIAKAISNKGNSSREIIRSYFIEDFFKDHCSTYSVSGSGKRPIYWLFDSGKQNGFKALVYMHRYDENTIGNLRIDYLHRMQRIYENEIARMQDTIENSKDAREVTAATKRKEKLIKQLQETKEYDEKIAHLALARTSIDLDDGVKVNYEKIQMDTDGKKLDVLAKI